MAKEICASRSSARTRWAFQGLIRRKSAPFEASVVSTSWRCKAARGCSLSQTSKASQRSRKGWRCGSDRDSISGSRKAHRIGEWWTIFVSRGRSSCWNKGSWNPPADSGDARCGKREPILRETSKFKELDRKNEKGRENGGFQPPVFANVQEHSWISF